MLELARGGDSFAWLAAGEERSREGDLTCFYTGKLFTLEQLPILQGEPRQMICLFLRFFFCKVFIFVI